MHTPIIEKIEVVTRGDVRRAKLYYLRDLRGKAAKIKEKRDTHGKFEAKKMGIRDRARTSSRRPGPTLSTRATKVG